MTGFAYDVAVSTVAQIPGLLVTLAVLDWIGAIRICWAGC